MVKAASAGHGIDRHLLGLQLAHQEAAAAARDQAAPALPRIFGLPLFKHAATWELSTSHLPTNVDRPLVHYSHLS